MQMSPPHHVTAAEGDDALAGWLRALEERHLADLRFSEVTRALRALSASYVERRGRLPEGAALQGKGKRAAFALFYGPLHFLLVRAIARSISGALDSVPAIVDLGCGTGASGSAWALACSPRPVVTGIDRSAWALGEARSTFRHFGLQARAVRDDVPRAVLPQGRAALLAAFTMNELDDEARDRVMTRLVERAQRGDRMLIVEPLARGIAPWWNGWRDRVVAAGGRADEWRFRIERPAIIEKLDRASGLDHRELTGRSLWLHAARRLEPSDA
jgi:hypothetical protein